MWPDYFAARIGQIINCRVLAMRGGSLNRVTSYRALSLSIFLLLALVGFLSPRAASTSSPDASSSDPSVAQTRTQTRRRPARTTMAARRTDYSRFSHATPEHKQACDSCHKFPSPNWKKVRAEKDAFPDITEYPQHPSCLKCHYQQFFARERPAPRICSVCHVNVAPRNSERYPFPSLNEAFRASKRGQDFTSDFAVNFPHETHKEVIEAASLPGSMREQGATFLPASFGQEKKTPATETKENCSVCHQTYQPQGNSDEEYVTKPPKDIGDAFWLKKGTFKTTPGNHATCFTCHSQEAGITPAPSDCNACHKLAGAEGGAQAVRVDFDPQLAARMGITDRLMLEKWRKRGSSGTFRHEGGMHPDQSCATCHNIATMNTTAPKTLKVAVQSCAPCHITATTDDGGALNAEADAKKARPAFQCTKCHVIFGKEMLPKSHADALTAAK